MKTFLTFLFAFVAYISVGQDIARVVIEEDWCRNLELFNS
jgi:hypothetical protein